jgi:hypothetical protein
MEAGFFANPTVSSPEELARRRDLVRAIKARAAARTPQNPWEGLNAVAHALGNRLEESRLSAAETAGRQGAHEKFATFLQNGPASPPSADALSDPWMSATQRDVLKNFFRTQAGGLPLPPKA